MEAQNRFKNAVKCAQTALKDPVLGARYRKNAGKECTALNLAISDYYKKLQANEITMDHSFWSFLKRM